MRSFTNVTNRNVLGINRDRVVVVARTSTRSVTITRYLAAGHAHVAALGAKCAKRMADARRSMRPESSALPRGWRQFLAPLASGSAC